MRRVPGARARLRTAAVRPRPLLPAMRHRDRVHVAARGTAALRALPRAVPHHGFSHVNLILRLFRRYTSSELMHPPESPPWSQNPPPQKKLSQARAALLIESLLDSRVPAREPTLAHPLLARRDARARRASARGADAAASPAHSPIHPAPPDWPEPGYGGNGSARPVGWEGRRLGRAGRCPPAGSQPATARPCVRARALRPGRVHMMHCPCVAWETPVPRSGMPASIEKFVRLPLLKNQ
jgi:hypothetical protein